MVLMKEAVDETMIKLIKAVYEGKSTIEQKIAILILTRRENHGNTKIQNACNFYLDKLYDKKYTEARNGFRIVKKNAQ